ncbi:G-protein coupled receptor Mth2 isoform X1 [Octopus bimaculoides]|uniref:G-protein coupled receptors family 2 profile 2 domain-containing protein n=1 Tax=Octopus bimaculoides TaxID=37653 RepID=A0A0L8H6V6_OCTBM|nr:G-protein coupled receptor Mth2 isoform X1 [Octopus bimaculoides]XP_052826745.1 G-protein coupled receptor Mth2 isoform X1 [Octopus bimaculoides]XP_052826746.1 G-protein coupled receptor Mth2 isoform X1 [Octopus bimaculoides]
MITSKHSLVFHQDIMEIFVTNFLIYILLINHTVQTSTINRTEPFNCPPVLCSESPWTDRCSCQQDCYLYDECCSDRLNHTNSDLEPPYPSMSYSCNNINGRNYYQFHRCPTNYDITEHVNNCENPNSDEQLHHVPAFGKTSKKLYRNLYCALCHGEQYILWKISYQCFFKDDNPNVTVDNFLYIFNKKNCEIYKQVPSEEFYQYLYRCTPFVSVCALHNTNKTLEHLCEHKPMRVVNANNTAFRNIYCALCNGIDADDIQCHIHETNIFSYSSKVFSLTAVFNFHTNSIEIQNMETNKGNTVLQLPSCPKHAVYDMNTKQCRQVIYHPQLNCTTTSLNESEYYITSDGRLYLNNTQRLLNQSEFSFDEDGTIIICVKNVTTVLPKYSEAETYITLVGLIFSIPALAITIIIYLCIPDLHTLPGKLLISLLSALFVAELLFLISSQVTTSTILCTSLAIVIHYSFLASFFWMNVLSFDAWYTFSGLTQLRIKRNGTKRLVFYSLYAWICPLVIVTISLIFEYTPGNHGLSPEYGNGICWITNGKSLLWLFAFPVMLILCLNTTAFILTTRGLYVASKLSAKYLSEHNKLEFIVCIKLFFIMGLTWTFAFLYTFTKIEEFSLIFCILNSFIGLFICLSFLFTKIVCRNILKKFRHISKWLPQESSEMSSTSQRTLSTQIPTKVTFE